EFAQFIGAVPVVTTQSDNAGLWALDTLDRQFGWSRLGSDNLNAHIFAYVNREPTALLLEARDEGTHYLEATKPEHVTLINDISAADPERYKLLIVVSPYRRQLPKGMLAMQFVPKIATYGLGLAHQAAPADRILREIDEAIEAQGLYPCACEYATIDVKRDEPVVKLLQERGFRVRFFTAEELAKVEVPHPSPVVEGHVGTSSVCEAAAILASGGGWLIIPKQKGKDWTVAVALPATLPIVSSPLSIAPSAHIEIVGAGPGDPDLISVRGRRFLEQADLILYAGSLVPKALTECHKPGAVVRSSADMNLEEQCALMKEHYDRGHLIVRLHTGDPCIFGAIQEQMAFFDREGMSYHITPGISSFLAAAAELRSQFTIPERTQTIILTRGEGRTPMPEREQLHLLARSQSTMCIFLSASIVDDVQRQLLQHYSENTPVAACYHLTWPDQKIYRGQLKDLAHIVHDNHLTLTTMLVVGEAIDNRHGLSELYNKHFTHLFRKGQGGE
ncbi:MAG: precorrin-4 C(11)-methyltransferase, partial [Bacteroidaceae bacterium]|nr:precorrin-4 C(11)-methyltransferase [Bacteroidaceae bacterium]